MLRPFTLPLGRWRGCRLRLDPALLVGLTYLGYALDERYSLLFRGSAAATWAALVVFGVVGGLVLHDAAHALTAWLLGGRIRALTFSFAGARFRLAAGRGAAEVEALSAAVGPATSLILGLALSIGAGHLAPPAGLALTDLGHFELAFGLANLLPAFPFDGGRILRALASRKMGPTRATELASGLGKALALAAVAVALFEKKALFLFVAIYLYAGAVSDETTEGLEAPIAGRTASDAMLPIFGTVSVHDLLGDVLSRFTTTRALALAVIATDGAPLGALAVSDLRRVAGMDVWSVAVGDLLGRIGGLVPGGADLAGVRRSMARRGFGAVAVLDGGGHLAGVLPMGAIEHSIELGDLVTAPPGA